MPGVIFKSIDLPALITAMAAVVSAAGYGIYRNRKPKKYPHNHDEDIIATAVIAKVEAEIDKLASSHDDGIQRIETAIAELKIQMAEHIGEHKGIEKDVDRLIKKVFNGHSDPEK